MSENFSRGLVRTEAKRYIRWSGREDNLTNCPVSSGLTQGVQVRVLPRLCALARHRGGHWLLPRADGRRSPLSHLGLQRCVFSSVRGPSTHAPPSAGGWGAVQMKPALCAPSRTWAGTQHRLAEWLPCRLAVLLRLPRRGYSHQVHGGAPAAC